MIDKLELKNFRSFINLELKLYPGLNILFGRNGIGKTNILEAIYVLAIGKSFRGPDDELINHGKTYFSVKKAQQDNITTEIRYQKTPIGKTKKSLRNNKQLPLSKLIGINPIVFFQPSDIQMFTSSTQTRRDFFDTILTQTNYQYLHNLNLYRKILIQRNALLRRYKKQLINKKDLTDQLFVCDMQLAPKADYLITERKNFIKEILPSVLEKYTEISQKKPNITIIYQSTITTNTLNDFKSNQEYDISAGHTTIGPHRDDFCFLFNDHPLASTASRGEMRSLLLAIILVQIKYIESRVRITPTLLLDDVFSELDKTRQKFLLSAIGNLQTIITTTDHKEFAPQAKFIDVEKLK